MDERIKKARAEFIEEALKQGNSLKQIEEWLNDPSCLRIINALCASGKGHKWISNSR